MLQQESNGNLSLEFISTGRIKLLKLKKKFFLVSPPLRKHHTGAGEEELWLLVVQVA